MADDLVQRARAAAETSIEPHAKHMFPQGTRHHVYGSEMRELLHALADALARKDAEIAELRLQVDEALHGIEAAKFNRDAQHQRAERAEARVREAPVKEVLHGVGFGDGMIRVNYKWIGKRVGLVLLDTEEAK